MLFSNFKNYEEFKELFGIAKHGNGVESRKNKILLAYIKDKNVRKFAREHRECACELYTSITSMSALKCLVHDALWSFHNRDLAPYTIYLNGHSYASDKYATDDLDGICEDGSAKFVRYTNMETDRVYKMKAGKMMRHLIDISDFGKILPEQVKIWTCEEFARDWEAYAMTKCPKHTLHIDDDFASIYDSSQCKGNFHSCMVDEGQHYFYEESVNASAAYLTNEDDEIIARCIIFNEVEDYDTGEIFRYAERQYSSDGDVVLQQALITALIEKKAIDCYKKVGAGCGDANAIVGIDGESWSDKHLHIRCSLDYDDTLSYQDTFKWYNMNTGWADNYGDGDLDLATTDNSLCCEWDDWHERYAREVTTVYYCGREYSCDIDALDDFEQVNGYYIHESEVHTCDRCGETIVEYYDYYDRFLDLPLACNAEYADGLYCQVCLGAADDDWKEDNGWVWSEYDGAYIDPDDEEVVEYYAGSCCNISYHKETISESSLERMKDRGRAREYNGAIFQVNPDGDFYASPLEVVDVEIREVA